MRNTTMEGLHNTSILINNHKKFIFFLRAFSTMVRMVIIRDIIEGKNLIKMELDTGESFAIPAPVAAQYRLAKGKIMNADEYRQLKTESERYFCKQKSLDYLSVKNRTSFELRKHLSKKGFSADIITEVICHLEETGLLDDFSYAVSYARSRRSAKLVGNNLIKSELHRKGLPRNTIRKAIEESGISNASIEEVLSVSRKKFNALKGKKNAYQKLSYFLQRRGFDFEIIQRVMERLKNEEGDEKGENNA
jgi:regulatory protein